MVIAATGAFAVLAVLQAISVLLRLTLIRTTHANNNVWPGPHMQTAMCGPRAKFLNPQKVFFCFLKKLGLKALLEREEGEKERWHD